MIGALVLVLLVLLLYWDVFATVMKALLDVVLAVPQVLDTAISEAIQSISQAMRAATGQLPGGEVQSPLSRLDTTSRAFLRLLGVIMTGTGLCILLVVSVLKAALEARWR